MALLSGFRLHFSGGCGLDYTPLPTILHFFFFNGCTWRVGPRWSRPRLRRSRGGGCSWWRSWSSFPSPRGSRLSCWRPAGRGCWAGRTCTGEQMKNNHIKKITRTYSYSLSLKWTNYRMFSVDSRATINARVYCVSAHILGENLSMLLYVTHLK